MAERPKPNRRLMTLLKQSVLEREGQRAKSSNYAMLESVLIKRDRLPIPRQALAIERPTLMVFADDAPLFNWAHPCRYLLHDAETGELYSEIDAQFPPFATDRDANKSFRVFHQPVRFPIHEYFPIPRLGPFKPRWDGQRHALLFSGMSNNRHTNDLEFLYRTLIDVYGYEAGNITVLNYDGTLNYDGDPQPATKWPGDGTAYRMPVDGKGSKAELLGALNALKKRLRPEDSLLIHTNNHGGHNGTESDLCCYPNWDSLGVKEFTDKLAELPTFRCLIVMMEQCHSGGFNAAVIDKSPAERTSIASACEELNNSIGGEDFDPFARDWIAAMADADPYGHALDHDPDKDHDGRVSSREAFNYADSIHHSYDTPVYNKTVGGDKCGLGRELIRWKLPPLLVWPIIRKFWPEPGPLKDPAVIAQLDTLEAELEQAGQQLLEEYTQKLTAVLKQPR